MATLVTGIKGNLGSALSEKLVGKLVGVGREAMQSIDAVMANGQAGTVSRVVHTGFDLRTDPADYPDCYLQSNLMATARLLEASARHGVKVFCYASSSAVLLHPEQGGARSPARIQSVYGATKACNEALVSQFCSRHGMRWLCCRIFNIFGGSDRYSIIARLDEAVVTGRPFHLNNRGLDERDFIHVDDVAAVITSLLDDPEQQGCIEIGNGLPVPTGEVVEWYRTWFPGLKVVMNPGCSPSRSCADPSVTERILGSHRVNLQAWLESRFAAQALRTGA